MVHLARQMILNSFAFSTDFGAALGARPAARKELESTRGMGKAAKRGS
jgi:hypothetical protein